MTTYRNIHGRSIKAVATDPTAEVSEGEIWYNTGSDTFKSIVALEAWSSGGSAITARQAGGAAGQGPQTAGLMFGGYTPPPFSSLTEEYNGSGFSTGGALPAAVADNRGAGTQTAALSFMGLSNPSTHVNASFEYDGSSWGSPTSMNTSRYSGGGAGIQTAGLAYGGYTTTTSNATEEYNGSSWTSVNNMSTARYSFGTAGIQTSAIAVSGVTTTRVANVEEYDGTNWTAGTNYPITTGGTQGFGATNTAAIFAGGATSPPTILTTCNSYNGTSFASVPSLSNSASGGYTGGSNTAGLYMSGIRTAPGTSAGDTEEFTRSANVITGAALSSGGTLNTGRYGLRGTGTQTAMVVAGGNVPPNSNTAVAEEYNGSSWTNTTSLPAVIQDGNMTGTETASIYAGGTINPGSYPGNTNAYNGSSWTSGGNMNTDVSQYGLTGTSTAAVAFGGYITTGPGRTADVQNYNGSSWTANPTSLPALRGLLRTAGTQTATFMAGGNAPPGPQPVTSFSYDGSSFSSEADSIVGMNDHGAWGTATEAYFMGGDQPTGTGGTGPKAANNFYYNGTSWATSVNMTTGKNTFGFSKSPNTAGLICGGNGPSSHLNTTEEFTEGSETVTAKTLTTS